MVLAYKDNARPPIPDMLPLPSVPSASGMQTFSLSPQHLSSLLSSNHPSSPTRRHFLSTRWRWEDAEHLRAEACGYLKTVFLVYGWMALKDVLAECAHHTEPVF